MGASSRQPLTLHLPGARDKQLDCTPSSTTKPVPQSSRSDNNQSNRHIKSSKFSPISIYKKCFQKSNISSSSHTEKTKWRVTVSPDEETGESMQITMLASQEDMIASSTSVSSDEDIDVKSNIGVVAAAGGEKRSSKLGNLFKGVSKKGGGGDNNADSNNQNGEQNDDSNGQPNGDGDNNNGDEDESSKNNNNNGKDFDPRTYFGPERISFAQQSTLPLHTGKESEAPTTHPSWTPATGSNFHVRVGPNYAKTGKKEPSLDNLYEVYSVRYFRSPCRTIGGATRIMPLPEMMERCCRRENKVDTTAEDLQKLNVNDQSVLTGSNSSHPELKNTSIPDVLVVHFMLPYKDPNMFKQNDDGPGGECVYYLRPSTRFLDEVSGKIPMTPATRLFIRWCKECQSNVEMRSRFKCMALVRDIDKHNFGLLKSYNGKPVLITESGRVCSGYHGDVRYLEMTANGECVFYLYYLIDNLHLCDLTVMLLLPRNTVHYWAYMAKKGFVSIIPKFKNMQ
jgi:hypothetical protein